MNPDRFYFENPRFADKNKLQHEDGDLKVYSVQNFLDCTFSIYWFRSKVQKTSFYFGHAKNEDDLKLEIANLLRVHEVRVQNKKATQEDRKAFKTTLKVGDIIVGSWGYDQTNVEAFQIMDVSPTGKTVLGRPVALETVSDTGPFSSQVKPVKDSFTGPQERFAVRPGDICPYKFTALHKWTGGAMHSSWGC